MNLTFGISWLLLGLVAAVCVHVALVHGAWELVAPALLLTLASFGRLWQPPHAR